jgi:DNA-binding response OmpR family regulator
MEVTLHRPKRGIILSMRLLFVEDSESLQRSVGTGLRKSGYAVDIAGTGTDGLWRAMSNDYDVIVLDIMLPGMDGLAVLGELRAKGKQTHVLLLTAKDTVPDRVLGLRSGADDYLVKPFAFDELLARIEALVRREQGNKNPLLHVGDLELDTAARIARQNGEPVGLLPREYALLEYLALRAGELVTRNEIEAHIYDERTEPMSNVIDSAICALRRKIDRVGQPSHIFTRRRMGYVLVTDFQLSEAQVTA